MRVYKLVNTRRQLEHVSHLKNREEGYEEIRGEIEMLRQCNHPNVVRYLGSYQGEEYLKIEIYLELNNLIAVLNMLKDVRRYSGQELEEACEDFSNIIGSSSN